MESRIQERENFVLLMEQYFREKRKPFKKHILSKVKISHGMMSALDISVMKYAVIYGVEIPDISQSEKLTKYRLIYLSLSQCLN